jgi:mRNA interferase RelE/StbE
VKSRTVIWSNVARADLRRIDQTQAMEILLALTEFAKTGTGDVERLKNGPEPRFRLRVGDYRVLFRLEADAIRVIKVGHRREVYR